MSDNDQDIERVQPPASERNRDAFRAVIEAVAQTNPVTGALARIYQTTHPSKSEHATASIDSRQSIRQFHKKTTR